MHAKTVFSRRAFLKAATSVVITAGLAPVTRRGWAAQTAARWPIAVRDSHLKTTGQENCWLAAKELGVTGLEVEVNPALLCVNLYHPSRQYRADTSDNLKSLRDDAASQGLKITAFAMNNRFDEHLDEELLWAGKVVQAAQFLQATAIRIDLVPRKLTRDQFLPFATQACQKLVALAKDTPVRFGIENHGNTTNDPAFLTPLFEAVSAPQLGLTLDTANFYWYGHPLDDLYKLYEKFASRAVHTHCKNIRYPEDKRNVKRPMGYEYDKCCCPIYEGDIDYPRLLGILQRANYAGDLCIEDESLGRFPASQRAGILKKEAAFLQSLSAR